MADARNIAYGAPGEITMLLGGNFANFAIDDATDRIGVVFQAETADQIIALPVRIGGRSGTPPQYRVSIQEVDPSTGFPNGTVLGGGSPASALFTPPADNTFNGLVQWLTLANGYTPSARGETIAYVVDYSSGTVNAGNNNSFSYQFIGSTSLALPYGLTCTAGTWAKNARVPFYGYRTAGRTHGFPVQSIGSYPTTSTTNPNQRGIKILLPGEWGDTYKIRGVRMHGRGVASGTWILKLYDSDGTTVLQDKTIVGELTGVTQTTHRVIFDEASLAALSYGSAYYLIVEASTTTGGTAEFRSLEFADAQDAQSMQGGDAFIGVSRFGVGAWTEHPTQAMLMEPIFDDFTEGGGDLGTPRVVLSP